MASTQSKGEVEIPAKHSGRLAKHVTAYADEQYIPDITVSWMYRPHAVSAFAVVVGFLLYLAWTTNSETSTTVQNTKRGIGAAVFFIIVLGMMVFPTGPFIRPHPILWRVVFGVAVCYEVFLIVLLFQNKQDARQMMTYFDDSLGKKLKERNYAANCALTWNNIKGNVFDIFVVGHFVGWVLKSLIIRDAAICWFISITWELIEITLIHMLPNFAECWWDQIILDVLLCNGLGIYVGSKLCDYLEMKSYDWKGVHEYPTYTDKVRRLIGQFAPESWIKVRWDVTSSLKRFFGLHVLVAAIHFEELNAFFLKYLLWIPPESSLNHVRLGFWFFFSLPCLRQFYAFMTDPTVKSIGRQSFLCIVIIATELLIIFKLSPGEFTKSQDSMARVITIAMTVSYIVFSVSGAWYIIKHHPSTDVHDKLATQVAAVEEVRQRAARQLAATHVESEKAPTSNLRSRAGKAANGDAVQESPSRSSSRSRRVQ